MTSSPESEPAGKSGQWIRDRLRGGFEAFLGSLFYKVGAAVFLLVLGLAGWVLGWWGSSESETENVPSQLEVTTAAGPASTTPAARPTSTSAGTLPSTPEPVGPTPHEASTSTAPVTVADNASIASAPDSPGTVASLASTLQTEYRNAIDPGECPRTESFMIDEWCFFIDYSTSYVASRLNSALPGDDTFNNNSPPTLPEPAWGHAGDWAAKADRLRIPRMKTPAEGHVAWWSRADAPAHGRVGIVEQVELAGDGSVHNVTVSTMIDHRVVVETHTCSPTSDGPQCGNIGAFLDIAGYYRDLER
ncbi:hypothetical protein [Candidatus Poriferisodalis sp.]|uniref:hypothetical protein n=1 Tax=Candidatus Poriferisodalis sp. TaxID=3101277 RepID=UPI003B01F84F